MILASVATTIGLDTNEAIVVKEPEIHTVYIVESKEITPKDYLRELAVEDFDILHEVIRCESGWKDEAINKSNTNGTWDVGLFQINDIHSLSVESRLNPYENIRFGMKLFKEQGLDPWTASKPCWSHVKSKL